MNDPEDEHDPIIGEHVIHDSVVAHPESMERVVEAADRLDRLALEASGNGDVPRQGLERFPKPSSDVRL
jgi:hypothetical protein